MCLSCWISNRQQAQDQDSCCMYHVKQNRQLFELWGQNAIRGCFCSHKAVRKVPESWDRVAASKSNYAQGFLFTYNMCYSNACLVLAVKPFKFLVALPQAPSEPSPSLPPLFPSLLSFTSVAFSAILLHPILARVLLAALVLPLCSASET